MQKNKTCNLGVIMTSYLRKRVSLLPGVVVDEIGRNAEDGGGGHGDANHFAPEGVFVIVVGGGFPFRQRISKRTGANCGGNILNLK